MEFVCGHCDSILTYGEDFIHIWTFHKDDEAAKLGEDTIISCRDCLKLFSIPIIPHCVICDKVVTTCEFTTTCSDKTFAHATCITCFNLPFVNLNNIVHKPCCSFECFEIERRKVSIDPNLELKNQCNHCGNIKKTMSRCARCKKVYYCNSTCQRQDWSLHKHNYK